MKLADEKCLDYFRQVNMVKDSNYYFYGIIVSTLEQYAIFGAFAGYANTIGGYLINYTIDGIALIPINNLSGKPMMEHACFIKRDQIKKVYVKSSGLFFYKTISIVDNDKKIISFRVTRSFNGVNNHRANIDKFISDFQD